MGSQSPFQAIFHWLGSSELIGVIDVLNMTFLALIGLSLMLGFKTKALSFAGIALLLLYYLAYPPQYSFRGWAPAQANAELFNCSRYY